jgi:hypothetical protein
MKSFAPSGTSLKVMIFSPLPFKPHLGCGHAVGPMCNIQYIGGLVIRAVISPFGQLLHDVRTLFAHLVNY